MMARNRWASNLTPEKVAAIRSFYDSERWEEQLAKVSNVMRSLNYIMEFEEGRMYKSSYIGDVIMFMIATINELVSTPNVSPARLNWLQGNLPVSANPKIEIGPDKIFSYALKVIAANPNGELKDFEHPLKVFISKLEAATAD